MRVISESSGMINYPSLTEKGASVSLLLDHSYEPGMPVALQTELLNTHIGPETIFKVIKVNHSGDTWTGEWRTKLELANPEATTT